MPVPCLIISSHALLKGVLGRARSLEGNPLNCQRLLNSPCRHHRATIMLMIMILVMIIALIYGVFMLCQALC